jgi:hypothetical protein
MNTMLLKSYQMEELAWRIDFFTKDFAEECSDILLLVRGLRD